MVVLPAVTVYPVLLDGTPQSRMLQPETCSHMPFAWHVIALGLPSYPMAQETEAEAPYVVMLDAVTVYPVLLEGTPQFRMVHPETCSQTPFA